MSALGGKADIAYCAAHGFARSSPFPGPWTAADVIEDGIVDFGFQIFVDTTTPLPGALPLFLTGLGALGLPGWRRKRKARSLAAL